MNATVNSASATGNLTILDSGKPLGTCKLISGSGGPACGFDYTFTSAGTHILSAYYAGDINNYPATSANLSVIVTDPSSFNFTNIQVVTTTPNHNGGSTDPCGLDGLGQTGFMTLTIPCSGGFFKSVGRQAQAYKPAAQGAPPTSIQYAIGQGPHAFATADFNGDGIGDAAVTNQADGTVSILLGLGNGPLQQAVTYPAGTAPTVIVTGDFNHDGKADWAVANASGIISVSLGFGDGTFALPIAFQASGSISVMAAADLNGDGVTDLVTLDSTTGAINVYLNDGNGQLKPVANSRQLGFNPQAVVLRDFNADGKLDLAVAYYKETAGDSSGRGTIAVLLGNGDGTFGNPVFIPGGRPISLETGSFSGAGNLDLLAGYSGASLLLYPGNGNGTFGSPIILPASNATGIVLGNFSGTGRTDIVAFNDTVNVTLLQNQPAAGSDLTLTKSHAGTLTFGQTGATYSLVVRNAGLAASSGTVTVTEKPPANLTVTAMSGAGWTCTTLPLCTRADALAAGGVYPAITVTVNIGSTAVSPLVNIATVSGGGDTVTKNNTASDSSTLLKGQTITFGGIPSQIQGTVLKLTASASSGFPVAFTSLTPSICTVSGATATLAKGGTCTIQATQAGNGTYGAASPVSQSVTVAPAFTITPIPPTETVYDYGLAGFVLELKAAAGFNGSVTLSCSGGPTGAYCVDLPMTVRFYNGVAYAVSGILFPANTPLGVYTVTFTGVSGSLTNTATATYTVKAKP